MFPAKALVYGPCPKCIRRGVLYALPGAAVIACDQCDYTEPKIESTPEPITATKG